MEHIDLMCFVVIVSDREADFLARKQAKIYRMQWVSFFPHDLSMCSLVSTISGYSMQIFAAWAGLGSEHNTSSISYFQSSTKGM